MGPRRFRGLASRTVLGRHVPVARGPGARLLGLALLSRERAGAGLLIPRCRSVHTFGMRFALDIVFLDRDGSSLREALAVPPGRIVSCRAAAGVLEIPAGVYTQASRVGMDDSDEGDALRRRT